MESIMMDVEKTFVEKLINGAIQKSQYIFCFKCIVKDFKDQNVKLEGDWETMKQRFKVATEKGNDIQFNAQLWKEEVDKLIQEDTETNKKCFFGFCPDCIWRYKRGRDLATKTKEIKLLMEKGDKLEKIELARHLAGVERYSSQYYISFKTREQIYKDLLNALKDEKSYTTGLYGMGGTGKTTLAKEVGKQIKTLEKFDHVIDTTVSSTPSIKRIQDDIAGSLGLQWGDINESDRPKKLWKRLTDGQKILLILDDVWENLKFDNIGIPNRDNHNGCKVLIITRNFQVCKEMVLGEKICMELLTEKEAWFMFQMFADLSDTSSRKFLNMGSKIAIQCKRLPVAIATIASSLKGQKRLEEWDAALNFLQMPVDMHDVDDDSLGVYNCFKLSYDYLKNGNAKKLFLLCSLFLEDEEISVGTLTKFGIGVGLFGENYGSYKFARSRAVKAKNELLESCLLLETEKGDVKMHDLVREVAQLIANKGIQIVNFSNKRQKSLVEKDKNIKYLSCEGHPNDLISSKFHASELEILIFNMDVHETMDIPISFFEKISGVRVLSLISKISSWFDIERQTLSLPQSINLLSNIRSLLVERCRLGDISVLGSLQSLETLDLAYCNIYELPHEITNLQNFRLLNLQKCKIECNNPFEVIQGCQSLEELYFCNSFNEFCQEVTLPTRLERYHFTDGDGKINDSVSKCAYVQQDYFSKAAYQYVMQTAEFLQLQGVEKEWRSLIPEIVPIAHGMNDLSLLSLNSVSQLQFLVDTEGKDYPESNVLSMLVALELNEMKNLEELCNGTISTDSMKTLVELGIADCKQLRSLFRCKLNLCNLKTLILRSCSTLVSVFDLSTSRSLQLLEKFEIIDCEKLESIFTYGRSVDDKKEEILVDGDNDNNKSCNNSMFSKLKVVYVSGCHKLQFIFPLLSAKDLLLLEDVNIASCDNLKYIFGQHQNVKLTSLKTLQLMVLPNFIDIFPETNHFTEGSSNSISKSQLKPIKSKTFSWSHICCSGYKLKANTSAEIPMVSDLNCLHLWERAQSLSRQSHILCNIKEIALWKVSKIKSVLVLSIASGIMFLETLTIKYCDELKHIIVDIRDDSGGNNSVFPKLIRLNVEKCEKLEYIFGHINVSDHQKQNNEVHLHLPALEYLDLCKLPSLIGMCTKNYHTTFPPLKQVHLSECSKVDIKSMADFIVPYSAVSIPQEISSTIKELSVNMNNMDHFLALKSLQMIENSNVENICYTNEANKKQMNLGLKEVDLRVLPMMTCLFVGPANCFSLQSLTELKIKGCEKLKIVFSACIKRCLPELLCIVIEECKELKYITEFEDDLEHKNMSNIVSSKTFFPKLKSLVVGKCKKLKYIFPIPLCKELLNLESLVIREADELEEIFKSSKGDDQKVKIPNLKVVGFMNLPSLSVSDAQKIQFQAVESRAVHKCPKLSLTSTSTIDVKDISKLDIYGDDQFYRELDHYLRPRDHTWMMGTVSKDKAASNSGNLFFINRKKDSGQWLTSSQELMKGESMDQQHPLEEVHTTVKPSQCIKETEDESFEEGSTSQTRNEPPIQLVADLKQKVVEISVEEDDLGDSQETTQTNNQVFDLYLHMESVYRQLQACDNGNENTTKDFAAWIEVQAALGNKLTFAQELMNEQSMDQQYLMNPQHSLEEIDIAVKPSEGNMLEGSTSEKTAATTTLSTISGTKHEPPVQLVAPKQKENDDGKICIPSSSIVINTKPTATKDVDIGESQETTATEDINKLAEENPILAFEEVLTGVQSFSIASLLQELKTLMDSSSGLDHLVSNHESKLKLISLFHGLNQYQELLPSDVKEYVEKVQNFFNDNINKHDTSQQVSKKHNQLLDSKNDLMNKLWIAKSTKTGIESETSTANAHIDDLSLQIDELRKKMTDLENKRDGFKSVVNECDGQKKKLMAECTEWGQQSKKILYALASSEVDVREAERARNLAKEGFANLKSSFPTF